MSLEAAIILAAGQSRRMGRPKQVIEIGGEALVVRAVRVARGAGLEPWVVLGAHREVVEAVLGAETRRVFHAGWSSGMGGSLRVGLESVCAYAGQRRVSRVAVMVCDQPGVTSEALGALLSVCREQPVDAAAAAYEGVLGTPAVFNSSAFGHLRALRPGQGARRLLRGDALRVASIPTPSAALDLDTPEDVAAWRTSSSTG